MNNNILQNIKKFLFENRWMIFVLILASFLRLWNLSTVPPHLTPDEASFGYNAYSILKTGKDMWGETLPLIFKSFGDFRPGLYFYLTVPLVAVFGLNEFAVRLPNAIFGVLGVLITYFLSKEMFGNKKFALIAGFMMAINPWHIYFSRGAWEPNVSLTLTLLAIYFFYRSLRKNTDLIFSSFFFALTILTYQGSKMATLVAVLLLVVVYWKELISFNKKALMASVLTGLFISVPIIFSLINGKAGRLELLSIFSYRRAPEGVSALLKEGNEKIGGLSYYLFHSQSLTFGEAILTRWFNHFSGRFLFFEGDWQNPRHSAPNLGMLLVLDLLLLLIGLINFIREKSKQNLFILLWLVFAPISSILSRDQVHAVRAFNMVIPLIFLLSSGIVTLISGRKLTLLLFGVLYFANYLYFLDAYFVHLPKHNSKFWYYGYKQVVEAIAPIQANYKTIKFQQSYDQPFIFFLFYQKYDPGKFQKEGVLKQNNVLDVGLVEKLDNIKFTPIDWSADQNDKRTLVVGDSLSIPENLDQSRFILIKEIKYLNGKEVAFKIVEIK